MTVALVLTTKNTPERLFCSYETKNYPKTTFLSRRQKITPQRLLILVEIFQKKKRI
jgi:hypothetical protein